MNDWIQERCGRQENELGNLPGWHSSKLRLLVVSYLTHSYWHAKAGGGRGRICCEAKREEKQRKRKYI